MFNFDVSILDYRQRYARYKMVCIRKIRMSSAALACRRAGSKRINNVSSCVTTNYKKNIFFNIIHCVPAFWIRDLSCSIFSSSILGMIDHSASHAQIKRREKKMGKKCSKLWPLAPRWRPAATNGLGQDALSAR